MKNHWAHLYVSIFLLGLNVPKIKMTRDLFMFLLGAFVFLYETFSRTDRPNLLYGSLALMGVAAYLRGTTLEKEKGDDAKQGDRT